jgi:hypothetical protein
LFAALAGLKEELDLNVKLACPDQFIPAVPGWPERSLFIARHGGVEFYHYDPYGQVLAKLQRGHDRDLTDVRAFVREQLVARPRLREMFAQIKPQLVRYPAVDAATFAQAVEEFCEARDG